HRLTIRPLQPSFTGTYLEPGLDRRGQKASIAVDSVTVPQGREVDFTLMLNRQEGQSGDVAVSLNPPPTARGLKLEQVVREMPKGAPPRESVSGTPVVKNGQNQVTLRLSADAQASQPGAYLGVYLQMKGF